MDHNTTRDLLLALPGVTEGTSYGTPGFRLNKKLLVRFHQDGESLVLQCDLDKREVLLHTRPDVYFVTDHYLGYPWILVRLAAIEADELRERLEEVWRERATRKQVAELEGLRAG